MERILKRVTDCSVLLGVLIPSVALIGWKTGNPILKSLAESQVSMNPTTAFVFILFSLSLLTRVHGLNHPFIQRLGRFLPFLGCVIVFVKLLSFFGIDLKIDEVFFQDRMGNDISQGANRMAPNTAITFIFLGLTLILSKSRGKLVGFQFCAFATFLTSILVLIGYCYESKHLIQVNSSFLPMAFNTGLVFFFLSVGTLCLRPDVGFMEVVLNRGPGGMIARRLFPAVIGLPIILGWIKVLGETHGLYDMAFGTSMTIVLMLGTSGSLIWWIARSLNISDRQLQTAYGDIKLLNQTLSEQNTILRESIEDLESFASAVSHDLRAPLRAISGFGEILSTEHSSALGEEGIGLIQRIIKNTQTMGVLIDSLLRLSRVSRHGIVKESLDLTPIANKILEELRRENQARQVEFLMEGNLLATGDKYLLDVALTNLLSNAWKYTGRTPQALIKFGCEKIGDLRTFFVADNGVGFDMTQAHKLFGAFQRLHSSQEFEGIGVGLTTVQRIIQKHGGRIWAEASTGKGATFYFTLPQ